MHGTPRRCPRAGQTVHSSGRGPDVTTGGFKGESGELGAGQEEGPRLDSHVWCTGGPRGGGGTTGVGMGLAELTRSGPGFSCGARTAFSLALLKGEETCGSTLGFHRLGGAPAPYCPRCVPGWSGLSSSTAICTTSARSCSDIIQDERRVAGQWAGIRLTRHGVSVT